MPLQIGDSLEPAGGGSFYLLEDVYLKGGLSVRDNVAARDAIAVGNLKAGQLVLTADDSKLWICTEVKLATPENPDVVEGATWEEMQLGGGGGGYAPNTRIVVVHNVENLPVDSEQEFELEMASSALVLKLETSRPTHILAYGTPTKDEVNPYEFISTEDHLADDGRQMFADGTIFRTRNYSIFANFEDPVTNKIYFTVKSVDETEGPVTITLTFVPIELAKSAEVPAEGTDDTDDTGTTPAP